MNDVASAEKALKQLRTVSRVPQCALDGCARWATHPGRPLVIADDSWSITGPAALTAAAALADEIVAVATQNDRVLARVEPYDIAVAALACWMSDTIVVPVAAGSSADFLRRVTEDCCPVVEITSSATPGQLDVQADLAQRAETAWPPRDRLREVPCIFYTSGSTGGPRGVSPSASSMNAAAAAICRRLGIRDGDTIVNVISPSFDYGFYQLLFALTSGASMRVAGPPFSRDRFSAAVDEHDDVVLPLVPSLLPHIVRIANQRTRPFSTVRSVTFTGSRLSPGIASQLVGAMPSAAVHSMYGLTECKRALMLPPEEFTQRPGSVGLPLDGVDVSLRSEDGSEVTKPGEIGELVVRGATVTLGYWNDPEATKAVFRPGPQGPEVWTGDYCTRDADGYYTVHGRSDDLVKINDVRVALQDVDDLLRELPHVVDAVAGIDADGALCADVVVEHHAGGVDAANITRRARERAYMSELAPKRVRLVDRLVLGRTGKPLRPHKQERHD